MDKWKAGCGNNGLVEWLGTWQCLKLCIGAIKASVKPARQSSAVPVMVNWGRGLPVGSELGQAGSSSTCDVVANPLQANSMTIVRLFYDR